MAGGYGGLDWLVPNANQMVSHALAAASGYIVVGVFERTAVVDLLILTGLPHSLIAMPAFMSSGSRCDQTKEYRDGQGFGHCPSVDSQLH